MDLTKLSREEKLKLLEAVEEKKKRLLLSKPKYKPNPGQLPVHMSKARERFVMSGNGSGKTATLVQECMFYARGLNPFTGEKFPVPAKIILVVNNSRFIDERIVVELKKWFHIEDDWLKRMGKPFTSRVQLDNGSTIDFYSAEADPGTFEGVESSFVAIDEPIPRPLYVALKRSLRIKGHPSRLLFCGTAVSEAWLRREIYEPWAKGELENVECFRVSSKVNESNLAAGYLKAFTQGLSQDEINVRIDGGFFDSEQLALSHLWNRDKHILNWDSFEYQENMPVVVAIDCHSVKPTTAVMLTVDREDRLYVIKELSARATASQLARILEQWSDGYKVIDWVCDSFGSAEGTSFEGFSSFIDVLNQNGIPVRPTSYKDKNHEDLIDRLRTCLLIPEEEDNFGERVPKLRVLNNCKGLIADIESCQWQKNRATGELKPKLDTSTKDFLSCLGYALSTDLFYKKPYKMRPVHVAKSMYGVTPPAQKRPAVIKMATRYGWRK